MRRSHHHPGLWLILLPTAYLLATAAKAQPLFDVPSTEQLTQQIERVLAHPLPIPSPPTDPDSSWTATLPRSELPRKAHAPDLALPAHLPPIAVVGTDPLSLDFLQSHHAQLQAQDGWVWVIHADSPAALKALQTHVDLPLFWGSAEVLIQHHGLRHYPVLLRPSVQELPR